MQPNSRQCIASSRDWEFQVTLSRSARRKKKKWTQSERQHNALQYT